MTEERNGNGKKVTLGILSALLLGLLTFIGGQLVSRVNATEEVQKEMSRITAEHSTRLVVLENKLADIRSFLERIESKLDRR